MKKRTLIDLRSDTVTLPTNEMWEAMRNASLRDNILESDPTVQELRKLVTEILGMEDAIMVSSGTMGNLVAIMAHTSPGEGIIVEANSHINESECGGMALIAGVQPRQIKGDKGYMHPEDIEANIRPEAIDQAATTLLALENSHGLSGGIALTAEQIASMCKVAKKNSLAIHLDGARLFNAAVALNTDPKELTRDVDSAMMSLSKGLSIPIGSVLLGSAEFIQRGKKIKKMLGGGMRQEGILAAAGITALKTMMEQLKMDNKHAYLLAQGLSDIEGIDIDFSGTRTNIVFFSLSRPNINSAVFLKNLEKHNIKALAFGEKIIRMVTHRGITEKDIYYTLDMIKNAMSVNHCVGAMCFADDLGYTTGLLVSPVYLRKYLFSWMRNDERYMRK